MEKRAEGPNPSRDARPAGERQHAAVVARRLGLMQSLPRGNPGAAAQRYAEGRGGTASLLLLHPERAQEASQGQRPGTPGKDPTASRPERAREPSPGQRPGEQTAPGEPEGRPRIPRGFRVSA